MAFKKGDIGNPEGGKLPAIRKAIQAREDLLELLPDAKKMLARAIERGLKSGLYTGDGLRAAAQVYDRVYGKPQQAVEVTGKIESISVTINEKEK